MKRIDTKELGLRKASEELGLSLRMKSEYAFLKGASKGSKITKNSICERIFQRGVLEPPQFSSFSLMKSLVWSHIMLWDGGFMKRVVLIHHPCTRYGVLSCMTAELQKALQRFDIDASLCMWETPDDLVSHVQREKPDCTWSINILLEAELCFHPLGVPHVYLSVDALTYCHPSLVQMPHLVCLFVDSSSVALYNQQKERKAHWFPHAISNEVLAEYRSFPALPIEDRPYDVALLGSHIAYDQELLFWMHTFPKEAVSALVDLAERCLGDGNCLFLQEISNFLDSRPDLLHAIKTLGLFPHHLVNSFERYVRGLDRARLLKALQGRQIHIFTDEQDISRWNTMPEAKGATFHTSVTYDQVASVCRRSKIVLNSTPTIRKGFHERLFLSLASGAVTVTSPVDLPTWLYDEGALVPYDSNSLSSLNDRLEQALLIPKNITRIVSWLEKEHTWDARLTTYLTTIDTDVQERRAAWESNAFWKLLSESSAT